MEGLNDVFAKHVLAILTTCMETRLKVAVSEETLMFRIIHFTLEKYKESPKRYQ